MNKLPLKFNSWALLLFLFSFSCAFGQLSKRHFIPPLTTATSGNATPGEQYVYISTPSDQNISYTIIPIGQPTSSYINGVVNNSTPAEILLDNGQGQFFVDSGTTSIVHNDKGYIIEANSNIYASVRIRSDNDSQAGALVSKGTLGFGTTFRAGTFTNENPSSNNFLSFISLMATEDNTNVSIDDLPAGLTIRNYAGTFPIQFNLDMGESYIVAVDNAASVINRDGLIGALISSDKDIVVNTGSTSGSFGAGGGRDFGFDQIVDLSRVGTDYIFIRGSGTDGVENPLIVAHTDNTVININGVANVATINAGDYYVIEGNNYSADGNMYVTTSQPVFAYQGIGGLGNDHNQGFFFVPPLSCENRANVNNIAHIDRIGGLSYTGEVIIITNTGADVTINDLPIAGFSTSGPFNVPGTTSYVSYKVTGLTGNVAVKSTEELYCAYINVNTAASSGSFYSGFPSPPQIDFQSAVSSLGNCIPNVTLSVGNVDFFDTYEWYLDTGSGFVGTGITSTSFQPTVAGTYKLVGTIACTGLTLESQVVVVSNCPSDFDRDNIIDNVDVDTDNDGISNLEESLGNGTIDLRNLADPIVVFPDSSTDNSIISSTYINESGSVFQGTNNGDFTSTITSSSNAELSYTLDFTNPVNISIKERVGSTHFNVDGEIFTVSVTDSKNITLVDPDNQLLVDTNFDGIFEAGVTFHSASEIRFIYSNSSSGSTPYQFTATQVNEVTFKHTSTSLVSDSEFRGSYELLSISKDTDNDGFGDDFDLDSDNDGIPDLFEANGSLIVLSNSDSDSDGLDDVFGGVFVTPINSDTDLYPDYLDLDSDNDGIYDLRESNNGQIDANLDGIIDNASLLIGANGFVDALETLPDSFITGYNPTDSDSDNLLNSTEIDSDNDNCYDVTEAGFTDQNLDGYLGDIPISVDNFGRVTSGIDGYTTPSDDYIIYAEIILNSPLSNIEVCEGDDTSIQINSNADTFQWEMSVDGITWTNVVDDTFISGSNLTTLQLTNIPISFNNLYFRAFLGKIGNSCGLYTNSIQLTVNDSPQVTPLVNLTVCDTDIDGVAVFDLLSVIPQISTNHINETFDFYLTQTDAENNINSIATPATYNNSYGNTIWVRTTSLSGCYSISRIELQAIVTNLPNSYTKTLEACDDYLDINGNDTVNNDDTDGIATFDFSSVTTEILTELGLTLTEVSIQYYRNQIDAINQANEIVDIANYRNIGYPFTQQIYVRINSNTDASCFDISSPLTLNVLPIPEANIVPDLELCDDDTDGMVGGFNLDGQTAGILGAQNPLNFTVSYHTSYADAQTGNNPLSSPYTNTVANTQTIYVRVLNNSTGCANFHTSFDLVVNPLPIIDHVTDLEFCDDDTDGFTTGIDLNQQTPLILGTRNPADYGISYHLSLNDAQNNLNPINSPFDNTVAFNQPIYVRLQNLITGCINAAFGFNIIVNPEPIANTISDLEFCDDNNDGFVDGIDLDSQISTILGAQDPNQFTVSFHLSLGEAQNGNNPISSPFSNTVADLQTIYVRVLNNTTGCFNADTQFDLIINPSPVLATPPNLELCDDDTDGFVGGFDLDSQTTIILNGLDPNLYTITYHDSLANAQNGNNPLSSPYTNTVANTQTIYVRGVNNTTGCVSTDVSFQLIVNALPVIDPVADLEFCDDDTDGFTTGIDLNQQTPLILGTRNPADYGISYHLSLNDAQNNLNSISSPFDNTVAFNQPIYVRLQNLITGCINAAFGFNIIVNPNPEAFSPETLEFCDDDLDGDDTNGLIQEVDLNELTEIILGDNQNPQDFDVTFHETADNAFNNINPLIVPFSNTTPHQQTIYIRVTNKNTGCFNSTAQFDIIVNPLPDFRVNSPQYICLDNPTLDLNIEKANGLYDYTWLDPDGNEHYGESLTITKSGIYYVTATMADDTGCTKTRTIEVLESEAPVLKDEFIRVEDGSDQNTIKIDDEKLGIGDYEYALLDENGDFVIYFSDTPYFENLKGGIYTIVARDKNGCGEDRLEVALVEVPKFFTPNDDGINDFWQLKGISSDHFPSSRIRIFNRYGKIIYQFTLDQIGWNGSFAGQKAISNDYWYSAELIGKDGIQRNFSGNFSLLRK